MYSRKESILQKSIMMYNGIVMSASYLPRIVVKLWSYGVGKCLKPTTWKIHTPKNLDSSVSCQNLSCLPGARWFPFHFAGGKRGLHPLLWCALLWRLCVWQDFCLEPNILEGYVHILNLFLGWSPKRLGVSIVEGWSYFIFGLTFGNQTKISSRPNNPLEHTRSKTVSTSGGFHNFFLTHS